MLLDVCLPHAFRHTQRISIGPCEAFVTLDRQEQRSVGTCSEHVRSEHVRNNAETLGALFAVISKAVHQYLKSRDDHHYGGSIVKIDTPFTIVISITNCYSFHNSPC